MKLLKVLDWIVKPPVYRLVLGSVILFLIIALAEGRAYWIGGVASILYLFLLAYASFGKQIK